MRRLRAAGLWGSVLFAVGCASGSGAGDPASPPGAPAAPSNLHVSETTGSTVSLTWTAASGAVSYAVWRGDASGANMVQRTSVAATVQTAQDTGLTAGTTWSYAVRAVDAAGAASANSHTVLATAVSGAASGAFKQPIPPNPVLHSNTAALVQMLADAPPVITAEYGTSVYTASDDDPPCTLTFTNAAFWGTPWTETIRIPAGARATGSQSTDPLEDHWLSVRYNGAQYDIWYFNAWNGAACDASGRGTATHGGKFAFPGPLLAPASGGSGSGSGISVAAGALIRSELVSDSIDHALNLVVTFESAAFKPPAWKADGACATGTCAKAGQRYYLATTDAVIAGIAHPGQRAIARALMTYGAFVTDKTARNNIPIEKSALDQFPYDYYVLDQIPWASLRALKCADGSGDCAE